MRRKRVLIVFFTVIFFGALLYSPLGYNFRVKIAERLLITRYQPYAWILVGKSKRDQMIQEMQERYSQIHCGKLAKNQLSD